MKKFEEILQIGFENIIEFSKKYRFTSVLILIFSIFSIPLILTQCEFGINLGLEKANEIGDAIGGTLGPYLSFIGSCLLAYTIYLQIEQRKDDETKYALEKLRLETESKTSNKRQFEKMIFETCIETLNKVEKKIHELNIITADMIKSNISIKVFTDTKSEAEKLNRQVMEKQVFNDFIDSMTLFNENKITEKAYQRIFINKIDNITYLIGDDKLLCWNSKNRNDNSSPLFFRHESIEKFDNVKNIFLETFKIKSNYQNNYDLDFQKDEIVQLNETVTWLSGFEADLRRYLFLKNGPITSLEFNGKKQEPTIRNQKIHDSDLKEKKVIEDKYNLNNEHDPIFV
ncbi:hypothetical protein MCERE19_03165 [Spirosomataceae bacterium]